MIIRDNGVWVRIHPDLFINLNYVNTFGNFLYSDDSEERDYNRKGLCVGEYVYFPTEDTWEEILILEKYMNQRNPYIVSIGDCLWIKTTSEHWVNINQVECLELQTTYNTNKGVSYRLELEIDDDTKFSLSNEVENEFRKYFEIPQGDFSPNFIWPPASMKKFDSKDEDELKWKRTLKGFLGDDISIINASSDEIKLLESSFDLVFNASNYRKKFSNTIRNGIIPIDIMNNAVSDILGSLIIINAEAFEGMDLIQEELAYVLIDKHSKNKTTICIAGSELEKKVPILLSRIRDYNKNKPIEQDNFTGVYPVESDKDQKIILPQELFGNIEKDEEFTIVGKGDHCEIWKRDAWERKVDMDVKAVENIGNALLGELEQIFGERNPDEEE